MISGPVDSSASVRISRRHEKQARCECSGHGVDLASGCEKVSPILPESSWPAHKV